MKKLGEREEQIMQVVWELKKAFVKEIIAELPDPKPHYNTVATMVRILEDKGFLEHESFGKTFRYSPKVSREEYQRHALGGIVKQYFNNSYSRMLAFFAKEEKISEKEMENILEIIKSKRP
ncbi:BlaI/MecI/CopY family transcriptional regulator [Xanthovirga aplysinae]|uniref:BlaI/MecI/CopY family transcriptional regulator n=1 Tax=Xanthovirga aplysinae TaxID=2529853 RepID=UPI0012BC433B|nr:BlaI/MecI/CopY family transcriptional regulator [Xanthovirga aplysinae]MTI30080.1 BlaI/MecI/CopY family transcriptional regulator [Xanthovirga aplysinae]